MTPAELLQSYYTLDVKRRMEWLAYLEELCEEMRAAKRGEAATAWTIPAPHHILERMA